jgi:hypothetical protein
VSPDAAGVNFGPTLDQNHRAELAEQKAQLLESEVQHLRAQLEYRVQEIQQERTAGEQLRVMLCKLEATNAEFSGALIQKALPPAPEEKPRVRWWKLWR